MRPNSNDPIRAGLGYRAATRSPCKESILEQSNRSSWDCWLLLQTPEWRSCSLFPSTARATVWLAERERADGGETRKGAVGGRGEQQGQQGERSFANIVDLDGKTHMTRCRKDVTQRAIKYVHLTLSTIRKPKADSLVCWLTSLRQRVMYIFPSKFTIFAKLLSPVSSYSSPARFHPRLRVLVQRAKLRPLKFNCIKFIPYTTILFLDTDDKYLTPLRQNNTRPH